MKNARILLAVFYIIAGCILQAQTVTIYKNINPTNFGHSFNRSRVISLTIARGITDLNGNLDSPIDTAVLIDRVLKEQIEIYARNRIALSDNVTLEMVNIHGTEAVKITNNNGIDIIVSFIKPDERYNTLINSVYGNDRVTALDVIARYRANFVIRVHKTINITAAQTANRSMESAVYTATLIGDTFQWLWGVKDGLSILSEIKPITLEDNLLTEEVVQREEQAIYLGYFNYRNFVSNEEKLYQFIRDIDRPGTVFVEELFKKISSYFYIVRDETRRRCYVPEEMIDQKFGDNRDYTLFYYDLLKRAHYSVKLLYIYDGIQGNLIQTLTLFKQKDGRLWGAIDENGYLPYENEDYRIVPSIYLNRTVYFIEVNADEVFRTRYMLSGFTEPYIKSEH